MDANELEDMISRQFPEENETELLAAIGKEIGKTAEFRELVRFRKEHPALTIPETEISLWVPGLDRGDYADPYWISESEERMYTEYSRGSVLADAPFFHAPAGKGSRPYP